MNVNDPADPLLPPPREGHHRSARERQRKGPMWGCLKTLFWLLSVGALLLFIITGSGWWYLGSASFAEYVRKTVEANLEAKLGRQVQIKSVAFVRTAPQKIILRDLRIANAPGGVAPYFATVREVEITGGIQSFWGRRVKVDRVDVRDPQMWFEVFPDGTHNFPKWKTTPPRRFAIYHMAIGKLFVSGGAFSYNDRKHDIVAIAESIASTVTVTQAEDLYEGIMNSPRLRVRLQDYKPFDVTMRGGFRYTPGILDLRSIALEGRGIEAFVAGRLDPVTEAVYNLRLTSRVELARVREIFGVEKTLEGTLALDTRLKGRSGEFEMSGGWSAPRIVADAYELTDAKGRMVITGENLTLDVDKAGYGGGTIGAHYTLAKYAEPYPMKVDLRYTGIGIEPLFSDWGIENTGLRSAATGTLAYHWNKDMVLEGAGQGTARLSRSTMAFSNARYPIPLGGTTDFALDNGVVTFRSAELDTASSHVSLTGTLRIEDALTDLRMNIRSTDFAELDRLGFNFALSAGETDYELLGLGGAGTIIGSVRGPIEKPQVVAQINGSAVRYNEVLLGGGDIALRYNGNTSTLTFERGLFTDVGGQLGLTGTIVFPDSGPGPRFDIAVEANGYPAQRAIDAVALDLKIGEGLATGRMIVAGTGEDGRATFVNTVIRRGDATLVLNGTVHWMPGEGNVEFDLAVAATNFPIADLASFLDFGDVPVTGELTGTLKIAGRKEALEGSGSVTVRNGAVMGEPVDLASADLVFTKGRMKATKVLVQMPAGEIRGEAELDLGSEHFSYTITSGGINPSKLKLAAGIGELLGGNIILESTGAGTFDQPELVIQATLENATLRGLNLPAGSAPPSLYLAIRNGRMIVRGSIAGIITIEGEGTLGEKMAIDGTVRVTVTDIAQAVAISPVTSSIPASGNLVLDLKLGGRLSPLEELVAEATAPVFNLKIADHEFTAPDPLRITLRNGRVELDAVVLRSSDSVFAVTGFAEVTGAQRVDVDVRGRVEAALLQLFVQDIRADGHMDVALGIGGTLTSPALLGTADLVDAEIRGLPQLIDEINGRLRFLAGRIEIESLRATVGGGQVVAGGFITLDGMTPERVRITLRGTEVAFRGYEGVTVEGNFTLLLSGNAERASITGDVDVTRALYFRDFDIQQTLLDALLSRSRVTTASTATWEDRIDLRVRLNAPGTLAIRNNLAELTGTAQLEVTGTMANPVILGEVTLDEGGTMRIQGVDYRVVRGTIAFQNPFRIDPFFDVTIEGTVNGIGSETESGPYDVTVNITGTLDRISPTITSDPPASDITLFSILGLGGLGGGPGSQQGGLGLMGESLLYQSLSSLIGSRVFPFVDSFSYDPGTLGSDGAGAKVTFEKRLSNKVRFLLVYNLENQQSRQVLEWLVNRDYSLQLTRDETDEYRLDARGRRRYDAHWRFGDDEEDFSTAATLTKGRTGATAAPGSASAPGPAPAPLPPLPPVTAVNMHAADGRTIAQINFRADARFDTNAVASEVTLKPGQTVTIRGLQSSIKNLFGTGNFRDVRVDSSANEGGGVLLTFALYLHYRVDEIEIEGLPRRDRTRAQRELTVRSGEILSLDDVDDSASAVQDMLRRNGFLEATVDPETNFDRRRSLADVILQVTPGAQAKVGEVILDGAPAPFTREQLVDRMKAKPGKTFQLAQAREDADRMKNFLVRRDHRRADVDFLSHVYDNAAGLVTLRYRVSVGPVVKVHVEGIARRAVRRWLPFSRNQEYSEDAIDQAADRIVQGLQQRGHYTAGVDTESELDRASNVWTSTFHVNAGPRYRLADVSFAGNIKVPEKRLRAVVATSPSGAIRRVIDTILRRPAGVTRSQIGDDRDALEAYYQLQGFSEATVATPAVSLNDAAGTITVDFPINEGPQTLLAAVTVEGLDREHHPNAPKPQLAAGDPLNLQLLHDDVVTLQTYYANSGHSEVQVTTRIDDEDETHASVTYVIAEGPHVDVGEVIVRGNTYTDREVILRRSNLEPGDPFSYTGMLEAQRELYRLGIFQRVEIQPEQTGTSVAERDVVIQVEEGKNLTLTGSVGLRVERGAQDATGASGEGEPTSEASNGNRGLAVKERLSFAAAHRNLFGTGRYLGLEIVAGREEQEFFLTYREPFISRWNVPLQLQIFQSDDSTRPGTTILQRGLSAEASKVALEKTRWSLRYEYKISKCDGGELCQKLIDDVPVETLDPSLRNIQISSITPTFFWDTRDDILDPHRGFFTSASVEYAFPLFAAKEGFWKEYLSGAFYLPLSQRTTLALSGRLGLIQRYARHSIEAGGELRPVPLSERFTAGGETSHRAFPLDLLGDLCRDATPEHNKIEDCSETLFAEFDEVTHERIGRVLPLGGSSMALMNIEYRFPIFGKTVGGAVFADIGNVFAGQTIQFDKLRYGAGFGLRYLSPVGPLRIDIASPFERKWYEDRFQYFFTLGYAF